MSRKPRKIDNRLPTLSCVCPCAYNPAKRRIENALALVPDFPVEVRWARAFFLNSWVPREGLSRDEDLSPRNSARSKPNKGSAGRVVPAASEEGLT